MTGIFPAGSGLFETLKTIEGRPFALGRHIARAKKGAQRMGIPFPSEYEIRSAVEDLLRAGEGLPEVGRLRMTFSDSGEFELLHENLHLWTSPARLTVLDRPIDEMSPLSGIKSLPFTDNVLCLELARSEGFDDGVRLNLKNEVCETSVANLLLQFDGEWATPHLASGCLPGITRELVVEWFSVEERPIAVEELAQVEAIFLLSSLKNLQPVAFLGGRELEIDMKLAELATARILENIDP